MDKNEERMWEHNIKIAYKNGIIEGIKRYAWWEDGQQYVGTHKKTLKQAIQEVEKEYEELKP